MLIDNGKTFELLNAIYGNTPNGKLKNKLIDNSPLSDTVLLSLIIENPLPPGNFKNVMQINLPVSKKVEPYFYEKLKTLPPGIAGLLKPLQAYNPGVTTLASIRQEIKRVTMQRQLYLNNLIILLNDTLNNRKEDAIFLLENEGTVHAEQALIATYLADSNYVAAAAKLAAMPVDDPEVADWVQLNQLLLSLFSEDKTLQQLDKDQIQFIRDLANKCPAGLGTSNAQAILHLLYREEFEECPLDMSLKSLQIPEPDVFANYKDENQVLGENYPDPAGDRTTIPYYLPEGINGRIEIWDINGRLINQYNAYSGEHNIHVDTKNWNAGIYIYTLVIEGMPLISKKMIINK